MHWKPHHTLQALTAKVFFGLFLALVTLTTGQVTPTSALDGLPPELYITSEPSSFIEYCQANYGSLDFEMYAITDEDPSTLSLDYEYNGDTYNVSPDSVEGDTGYFSVSIPCDAMDPYTTEDIYFRVFDGDGMTEEMRSIEFGAAGDDTVPQISIWDAPPSYIDNCSEDVGSLFFSFQISDGDNLDSMSVEFGYHDMGHGVDPVSVNYEEGTAYYEYTAECSEFEPGEYVTFEIDAYDDDGMGSTDYSVEFGNGGGGEDDFDAPVISFDTSEGLKPATFTVTGNVDDYNDQSNITYMDWWVDEAGTSGLDPVDGNFDSPNEEFSFEVAGLSEGTHQITVRAFDANDNYSESVLNVDVDATPPTCTGWTNLPNPVYTDELTYTGITCTDNRSIADARYRVYHYNYGDVYDNVQVDPVDESFGGDTEQFSFTITLPDSPNQDGPMSVYFRAYDEVGNASYDEDPIVVDYEDQTAPTVNLTSITPDPLADTTPTITGSCVDNTFRETNSNIAAISVSVDGGEPQNIDPLDDVFDSSSERFSYTTEELALGEHEIEVTCTDAAGNFDSASDDFEIVAQDENAEPGAFDYEEQFESDEYQDVPNTTLVWGNGRLRLRENITIERTPIDTENFRTRYATDYNDYSVVPGVTPNTLWYSKQDTVARYNITTDEITYLDHNDYGVSNFGTVNAIKEFTYEGDNYLVVTSDNDIFLLNITDTTGIQHFGHGGAGNAVPDVNRGRFGLYLSLNASGGGNTSLAYWDLNNTFEDTGDDIFTVFPEGASAFEGDAIVGLVKGFGANELYLGSYNHGLYRFTDNNTPTNFADDQAAHYSYGDVFGAVTFDPDGKAIFATANVDNGEIFVILDDNGTPYNADDDTVQKIANARQVGYKDIFGLTYLEGQNDVGDQIIIKTETANIVYFNFNSTYENLNDDTFIELQTDGGVRPSISNVYVYDYDTFYVVVDVQGLYEVNLTRGWADSGQAVGLPPRPPETLLVNNFTAAATTLDPLSQLPTEESSSWLAQMVPQAYAAGADGITYEVSVDDGVTWQEVTLGELQQLAENDYRLQFRITMEEQEGTSPALSSYSLNFGGYVNEDQIDEINRFGVSVSPSSSTKNSDFTVTVEAQDILGHRVTDYSGPVNIHLVTNSDADAQSAFNVTQITLVNGVGSVGSARVSQAGQFKVNAEADGISGQSGTFTITNNEAPPTPTMTFLSNNYEPYKGQGFTLTWSTTHLTSLTLNPGNYTVEATGAKDFVLNEDTTYTLTGTGPYGGLTSTITIRVKDGPAPSTTPSPSPSGSPSPNATISPNDAEEGGTDPTSIEESSSDGLLDLFKRDQLSPTELSLVTSDDITIIKGEKVTISWESANADSVIVDYFGKEVALKGSFEFYPTRTQDIKITARKGDKTVEKVITITVKELPGVLSTLIPPSLTPVVSAGLRWSGLGWLAAVLGLFLLGFNKRRPKNQAKLTWWHRLGYTLATILWLLSPLVIVISIVAAAFFTTPWLIIVAVLCVLVFIKRVHHWLTSQPEEKLATFKAQ